MTTPPPGMDIVERLRELLAAATPGNWFTVPYGDGDSIVIHSDDEKRVFFPPVPVGYSASPGSSGDPAQIKADMELIAAARNTLPALLDEITRLRRAAPKWQPRSTAPKDGTVIWAWLHQTGIRRVKWSYAFYIDGGAFVEVDDEGNDWEPQFWLPYDAITLPSPPTSQAAAVAGEDAG